MAIILDGDDLLNQLSSGKLSRDVLAKLLTSGGAVAEETIYVHKEARVAGAIPTTPITGWAYSLFQYDGCPLGAGATPAGWANPDNTTAGGFMQANASGGRTKYSVFKGNSQQSGTLVLYDRLAHCGNLDGVTLTAQNVNGGLLGGITRYTNGVGVQAWLEIYNNLGTTLTTITANYTDGANAAQVTPAVNIGGTGSTVFAAASQMMPLSAAVGSSGVKGVTSVTLAASTGSPGQFGVTLLVPLAYLCFSAPQQCGFVQSFINGPLIQPASGACLSMMWIPSGNAIGTFDVELLSVEA